MLLFFLFYLKKAHKAFDHTINLLVLLNYHHWSTKSMKSLNPIPMAQTRWSVALMLLTQIQQINVIVLNISTATLRFIYIIVIHNIYVVVVVFFPFITPMENKPYLWFDVFRFIWDIWSCPLKHGLTFVLNIILRLYYYLNPSSCAWRLNLKC